MGELGCSGKECRDGKAGDGCEERVVQVSPDLLEEQVLQEEPRCTPQERRIVKFPAITTKVGLALLTTLLESRP